MPDLRVVLILVGLVACGGGDGARDAGEPRLDADGADAAADAGSGDDAARDAGGADAGPSDGGGPDADRADAGAGGALPLGTVTAATPEACSGAGESCHRLVVDCAAATGAEEIVAHLAVTEARGSPLRGTVVHFSGGGGTTFSSYGNYASLGFRSVEVRYESDWAVNALTPGGVLEGACRPATVLRWVFDELHGADRTSGFCAQGFSGGSAQVAFTLAHYGSGEILDHASFLSGPPYGRIDFGCDPASVDVEPSLCGGAPGELSPAPFAYERLDVMRGRVGAACGTGAASDEDRARWIADSVVQPGARLDTPLTPVAFFYCTTMPNEVTGQGAFYASAITSAKSVGCYTDCRGEGVTGDMTALRDLRDGMVAGCVPRH